MQGWIRSIENVIYTFWGVIFTFRRYVSVPPYGPTLGIRKVQLLKLFCEDYLCVTKYTSGVSDTSYIGV